MEPTDQKTHYTRDDPIWWQSKNGTKKAFFVVSRKTAIVIDVLLPDGSTRRKLARPESIQPREEEQVL